MVYIHVVYVMLHSIYIFFFCIKSISHRAWHALETYSLNV